MSVSSPDFSPGPGRIPRAGVDPITSDSTARSFVELLCPAPLVDEVLVVMLDDQRRGLSVLQVAGTTTPDAVLVVADAVSRMGPPECAAVVLVSSRPSYPVEAGDVDRWIEASDILDDAGIELVEWYVVSEHGVECPRDLFGEPPRWSESRWRQ